MTISVPNKTRIATRSQVEKAAQMQENSPTVRYESRDGNSSEPDTAIFAVYGYRETAQFVFDLSLSIIIDSNLAAGKTVDSIDPIELSETVEEITQCVWSDYDRAEIVIPISV